LSIRRPIGYCFSISLFEDAFDGLLVPSCKCAIDHAVAIKCETLGIDPDEKAIALDCKRPAPKGCRRNGTDISKRFALASPETPL
jgi:hypothetical protein